MHATICSYGPEYTISVYMYCKKKAEVHVKQRNQAKLKGSESKNMNIISQPT